MYEKIIKQGKNARSGSTGRTRPPEKVMFEQGFKEAVVSHQQGTSPGRRAVPKPEASVSDEL